MDKDIRTIQEIINTNPRIMELTKYIQHELREAIGKTDFVLLINHESGVVFTMGNIDSEGQTGLIKHMADNIHKTFEETVREH